MVPFRMITNWTLSLLSVPPLSLSLSFSPSGQRGVYKTSNGLQLAYLSGSYVRRQFTGGDKRESQLVSIDTLFVTKGFFKSSHQSIVYYGHIANLQGIVY